MLADLISVAIATVVFYAGFACGRLDRDIRRAESLSADDLLRMLRENCGPEQPQAGGQF